MIEAAIDRLEAATRYELRYFVTDSKEGTRCTEPESFATYFSSIGNQADPHLIHGYDELWAFNEMVAHGETFTGQTVRLLADIDLNSASDPLWTPMASSFMSDEGFNGEFDGNGKVISGMKISTDRCFASFFGICNGLVHDLTLKDAEILCKNNYESTNRFYAGVGGIIGSCTSFSPKFKHLVERCGFTGSINGGNAVGGIAGGVASIDAVNDCYAIGNFSTPSSYIIGGIIGEGNALNSYFVGSLSSKDKRSRPGAISYQYYYNKGQNTNCYADAENCYYQSSVKKMSSKEMKTPKFASMLSSQWAQSAKVNYGYPVLKNLGGSRVTTDRACTDRNADIEIHGIYTVGLDKDYNSHGFQWYAKSGESPLVHDEIVDGSEFVFTIPNVSVGAEGINYRAMA